ncbi:MAG TPA: chloride channel protein [Gemmatimonadaceae bacterium]
MPESSAEEHRTRTRPDGSVVHGWSRRIRIHAHVTRSSARRSWNSVAAVADALWQRVVDWFNARELSENAILIGFAVVMGIGGALGVVAFYKTIDLAFYLFYRWPGTFLSHADFLAYRPLLTAVGLGAAWWVVQHVGRKHEGMNVPDVQLAVVRRGGDIPLRPALARTAASAITLGSGGSAGSEGPVAVLGSAIGSFLGRAFQFSESRMQVLVGCGAAAGISAAFNAPLAGAFFAIEEILGSFAVGSFPPVVVSSVIAAVISRAAFGNHPAFPIPEQYGYALTSEVFLFYPLLGVVTGVASALYVRTYFFADTAAKLMRRIPVGRRLIPWIGGLLVGTLVFISGGLLVGYGHLAVHLEVFGRMAWYVLALLALGKIVATSITLNFGGSGGVFTPSLYIGAATGGAFGAALVVLFPGLRLHPEAYALVGMGALIAGATDAPITGILIVFEMTNDYAIVLPLMLATVISYVVARRIEPDSLYSGWLHRRGERIEHGADRDVLVGLCVSDAYEQNPQVIGEQASLADILEHLGRTEQGYFPVIDPDHQLVGVITMTDLGRLAKDYRDLSPLLIAADVAQSSEVVAPNDSLLAAIRKMGVRGSASLPVVDPQSGKLVGLISRSHILGAYERSVAGSEPIADSDE